MFVWLSVIVLVFSEQTFAGNESIACCPADKFVSFKMSKCWVPKTNETENLRLTCKNMIRVPRYSINSEGNVVIPFPNLKPIVIGPELACVGNETNKNQTASRSIALLCAGEKEEELIPDKILGYCMIISVIFLTFTVIIYTALPELRMHTFEKTAVHEKIYIICICSLAWRETPLSKLVTKDLQGKSIINLCGSLGIGLGILSIMKLMRYTDMNLCATRGFLTYFFIIAAFFWTNAISIQVLRSTRKPSIVDNGWREFSWYALYAWGCPTILTIIMAVVNFHPGMHSKPGIGLNHCWFLDKEQQWYYMYSVMSILITANIFIFIYTSTIVWRHTFSTGHIRALRYRLTMTIRLIIVMGLLWIFEMVGSLAEKHIVWALLDVVNTLQGPMIFLVLVVFRKRVIKAMLRHGWLDCISGPVETYLAAGSDAEENVIQHTDVPMNDR